MAEITISEYELIKEIGSGASGRVYLARSLTGVYRAVKIVRRAKFDDAKPYEREFTGITEYEPISRKHDGLIDLLHVGRGEDDSFFYYVMELADNWITGLPIGDETELIEYQPRTLQSDLVTNLAHPDAINIILKVARCLKGIHDKGLVHRDIKPANIVYVDNEPKLADPGLIAHAGSKTVVGTFGYVAPEITFGQPAIQQSDIYSLGKLFYQLFTGLSPEKFPELPDAIPKNPIKNANRIWNKACNPDPEDRYPGIDDFIKDLIAMSEETEKTTRRPPAKPPSVRLHLTDAEGSNVEDQHLGEGEYSIGRSDTNDVIIPGTYVSRHHASLYVTPHGVELEDKHSTGGTFVDGMKVSGRVPVNVKQTIQIGDHHLYVSNNEPVDLALQPGEKLCEGRFVLQQRVGRGTSAEVWRAFDVNLQEDVALKIFSGEWRDQNEFLPQLRREVKKARKLNHENILNVYDIHVSENEIPLISMEYVRGKSLEDHRRRQGVIAWSELSPFMDQLCSAVDYAHSKKIVHRDIKPANILINRGRDVKLADFGVARAIVTSTLTRGMTEDSSMGELAGTVIYMSPQVLMGESPSPDDDIYAIGVTLYFLLTGFVPFYDENFQTLTDQICNQPAQPIDGVIVEHGINNTVPEHICAAIMACLSKNQDHRPKKARLITANYS